MLQDGWNLHFDAIVLELMMNISIISHGNLSGFLEYELGILVLQYAQ